MKKVDIGRRDFVRKLAGGSLLLAALPLVGCGRDEDAGAMLNELAGEDDENFVTMYDTYAMALYMDGGLGPKTGVVKVDYIIANQEVPMQFWHGHGGKQHQYTLKPEHFAELKLGKRVLIETTPVDGHTHKLFIDPRDTRYRVPGAQPIKVPR